MVVILGIPIPSTDPVFLGIVAIHIPLGLATVIAGAAAIFNVKGRGRHSRFGTIYFWLLSCLLVSGTILAVFRWRDDYHLFILGLLAFVSALFGRTAVRRRWRQWPRLHLSGMGFSYILMLTAFLVDNGQFLPVWRDLPHLLHWLIPAVIGMPFLVDALVRHPRVTAYDHSERRGLAS
jgi:hypothetical protein